jgi:ATP-dependent Clp protease ATP-binding subunit ClpA
MFERFTPRARQIVIHARQEAAELHHPMIGTEHLLLALLAVPGAAGDVLHEVGLRTDVVRTDLVRLAGTPPALVDDKDAEALRSVGIDVDAVLARIQESFGPQALVPPATKRGWFGRQQQQSGRLAPHFKKVLELSFREAVRMQYKEIHSEHLLLGLLQDSDGPGCRIMADAGLDLAIIQARTERLLARAA